jgi:hypothetical protein
LFLVFSIAHNSFKVGLDKFKNRKKRQKEKFIKP